jgi:hypothetical protein
MFPPVRPAIRRAFFASAVAWFIAPLLRAHDPYETWTSATLRPAELTIELTMNQATALRLIDPTAKIRGLTLENLDTHRPALEREAAAFFIVTAGRTPLKSKKIEVELTEENDVAFKLVYPRPPPGRLHFHAAFMKRLGEGYGGILEVADTEGNHLGWEQLTFENPNLEVVAPAPGATKKP